MYGACQFNKVITFFYYLLLDMAEPKKYYNGELNDGTNYAVFQRSFDSYGSYESEDVIRFTTKKSFPTTIVVVSVVVGVVAFVILVVVVVLGYRHFRKIKGSHE